MNLTINALSLYLITSPTLTFLHQNLKLSNLNVFYSFDNFIFGNSYKFQKSTIMQSTFSHFLSTPISFFYNKEYAIGENTTISNRFVESPLQYSQCCDYEFISNTFFNCISKGNYNQGGAIYISCDNRLNYKSDIKINVKITNNCFLNCESDQGGAFYIVCSTSNIEGNSFKSCEASYYSIFHLYVEKEATVSQSYFLFSKKEESTHGNAINIETKSDLNAKNLNVSSNNLRFSHSIFCASSPLVGNFVKYNYFNFFNCTSKYILSIASAYNSHIENSNFIRNQGAEGLIELKTSFRCQSCSFISDNSKLLTTKQTLFSLCIFDDDESQVRFGSYTISNCRFNSDKTFDVKINSEPFCITKDSGDQDSNNKKEKIFLASFLPIFLCIVAAVIIFTAIYGYKHNWFSKKTDTIPLMYV